MARHTTFRFCLDPTVEQFALLSRHAGASRFAFNQSLRLVKAALAEKVSDPTVTVPWSGFDLINGFNAWKHSETAGRVFTVAPNGTTEVTVTGLAWRAQVCQQVFEEAAVDLGRALGAFSASRADGYARRRVGFPRFTPLPRPEARTPEKGAAGHLT
jgi:putative transposase